jgi:hypothetical protein
MTAVTDQLAQAQARCRDALADPKFAGLSERLPGAPHDAPGWFTLLQRHPHDPAVAATLRQMKAALPAEAAAAGVKIEQFAALNAFPAALAEIGEKPLPDAVKRLYAAFCSEVAGRERQWEGLYNIDGDPEPFHDLAAFATLRGFPVGDAAFSFGRMSPLKWALRVHPKALPGFVCELALGMKGTDPAIMPHVNYGRKTLVLQRAEYERSLWLMAKTLEFMPDVKGLCAVSWLHSSAVGDVFPHLAWMRTMFTEAGAHVVELDPSTPWRYGFNYNNPKRLKLYQEGKFHPRQTVVLWPRDEFLAWAADHPALGPADEPAPALPEHKGLYMHLRGPRPSRQSRHNSAITLWDGEALYHRWGRLPYALAILLIPALGLAVFLALLTHWWAAIPAFPASLFAAHAFQYFFSQ